MEIDTHELAWAAGFFDGEGCTTNRRAGRLPTCIGLLICIGQSDIRPLERFKKAVGGLGYIRGPMQKRQGNKPVYRYDTGNFMHAQAILAMIWKWLGPEKREQAIRAMKDVRLTGGLPLEIATRNLAAYNHSIQTGERKITDKQFLARSQNMQRINAIKWAPKPRV